MIAGKPYPRNFSCRLSKKKDKIKKIWNVAVTLKNRYFSHKIQLADLGIRRKQNSQLASVNDDIPNLVTELVISSGQSTSTTTTELLTVMSFGSNSFDNLVLRNCSSALCQSGTSSFSNNNYQKTLELFNEFSKNVNEFATHVCYFCKKTYYKHSVKYADINSNMIQLFKPYENLNMFDRVKTCSRCLVAIKKWKIPCNYYKNKMQPPICPPEIETLSDLEIRLISLVRPYQRIYNLRNGRGQNAVRGVCVYFGQAVEEVTEQLPILPTNSDTIVVIESLQNVTRNRSLKTRPNLIYNALRWLKVHNKLYSRVNVVLRKSEEYAISEIVVQSSSSSNVVAGCSSMPIMSANALTTNAINGFTEITLGRKILRASFHQGSIQVFGSLYSGTQCTAMSAAFLCASKLREISTWNTVDLDEILLNGDSLYRDRFTDLNRTSVNPNRFLMPAEVCGQWIFKSNTFFIESLDEQHFNGVLNRGLELPSVPQEDAIECKISLFIRSDFTAAILTCRGYSMGLLQTQDRLYSFDSHSRGMHGMPSNSDVGKACVIGFPIDTAARDLSNLIHRIFPCRHVGRDLTVIEELQEYVCSIQPMRITLICDEAMDQLDENEVQDFPMPIHRIEEYNAVDDRVEDVVVHVDDYIQPDVNEFLDALTNCPPGGEFQLYRKTAKPLNSFYSKHLDSMSFVKLYPYGTHDFEDDRFAPITILDYCQTLILGTDKRFRTPEFIFNALSRVETYKLTQMCAVVGNLNAEGSAEHSLDDLTNLHLVFKGMRGSPSYWKNYSGDLIAMIKQLGIPTFFLTISYDDLNSIDAVNALWKAKHGEAASIDPKTLSYEERKKLLDENPVAAARHFNHRLRTFLRMLKSNGKDIFGLDVAHYIC